LKGVQRRDLQTHLATHGNFQDQQIEALLETGLHTADRIPARDCPFCREWATKIAAKSLYTDVDENSAHVSLSRFKRHVATHQEQLALFSIPQSNDDDEIENEDVSISSALSKASSDSAADSGAKTDLIETDEEWRPFSTDTPIVSFSSPC